MTYIHVIWLGFGPPSTCVFLYVSENFWLCICVVLQMTQAFVHLMVLHQSLLGSGKKDIPMDKFIIQPEKKNDISKTNQICLCETTH